MTNKKNFQPLRQTSAARAAATLILTAAFLPALANGQDRALLGYDPGSDSGYLNLFGTNGRQSSLLWVASGDDDRGMLLLYNNGGNSRVRLLVDSSNQGDLRLRDSSGQNAAVLMVRNDNDNGQLWLGQNGQARATLKVDDSGHGDLRLRNGSGTTAAAFTIRDDFNTGELWLGAGGTSRAILSVDSQGQGLLKLQGSDNRDRARLDIYDRGNSGHLRLYGRDGQLSVFAGPVSGDSPPGWDLGRLVLYSRGATRVDLRVDPASGAGRLILRNTVGEPTIELDAGTGDISKSGSNGFLAPHPKDPNKSIYYASLEGPERGMYVRGTAKLSNGRALVRLPEHFRVLADATSITVQLTPNSADTYGLATVKKTPANIEVRELGGSKGNFSFDYVVVAARSDLPPLKVVRKRNSARPDDAPSDGNSGGDLFDREEPDADSGTKEEEEPDREPPRLGDSPPRTPGSQAN